jgi:hypothetical protein
MPKDGFGNSSVTPLTLLKKDGADSRDVWLQTSFFLGDSGDQESAIDQDSFVNVALGGTANGGLVGERRGGSHVDVPISSTETRRDALAFTGDVATLAGPGGSHFMGTNQPNIVMGFDSTGTKNIGRDIPLDPADVSPIDQGGASYHIGIGTSPITPPVQTFDGTYKGYAAGMVESEHPEPGFYNVVKSTSPDGFAITFNKITNTLSANVTLEDVRDNDPATSAYQFKFGNTPGAATRSAYIDNQHYAAIESVGAGATIVNQDNWQHLNSEDNESPYGGLGSPYAHASSTGYLVSGEQLNVTAFLPETFGEPNGFGIGKPFCKDCDFMQWGAMGARVNFGNSSSSELVDNIHLGWWVAGDIASAADLNSLDQQNATATYDGHVIGNVANNVDDNGLKTYVAGGDLGMTWNFGSRKGELTIDKFDTKHFGASGLSFSGCMKAPGVLVDGPHLSNAAFPGPAANAFQGHLGGFNNDIGHLGGFAAGSFVNDGAKKAAGVLGNWNIAGQGYKATGIFAGVGTPIPHVGD